MNQDYEEYAGDVIAPPHSTDAEQSVLGALMLHNRAWDVIHNRVLAEDFYREDHRLIFRSIETLIGEGKPLDWITLSNWLKKNDQLEEAGGTSYLGTLAKDTPSAANVKAYADIVREKSILRSLIAAGIDLQQSAFKDSSDNPLELAEIANDRLRAIISDNTSAEINFVTSKAMVNEINDIWRTQQDSKDDNQLLGISTGIAGLNDLTQGYCDSDLIIVAGRPAMGKSSFGALAEITAMKSGVNTFHANLEMPNSQIGMRMISIMSGVPLTKIRSSHLLEDNDWARLFGFGVKPFSILPYYVDDTATQTTDRIRQTVDRAAEACLKETGKPIGLITIDYLQLLTSEGRANDNRNLEVGKHSRALKVMAKELGVPVIALSQLSRSVDSRSDKRPVISDLRDSGSIEQDADIIIFPYRDCIYNDDANPDDAEIVVAKNRNGSPGSVRVGWEGKCVRFYDVDFEVNAPR